MIESNFEDDEMMLAQLKTYDNSVLSLRHKAAIKELAEHGQGALIFLFLSMNKRISDLEAVINEKPEGRLN